MSDTENPENREENKNHTLKMSRPHPAPTLTAGRKGAAPYLRRLGVVGVSLHQGVSDTHGARWKPATPGERLAVWQFTWRWTRCGNPRCRCARSPEARHGPYLSLRVSPGKGERYQVYIPQEAAAEIVRAVRRAKGVRKRRLRRERMKAQQDVQRAREELRELRWARAVLNAAYGRPR